MITSVILTGYGICQVTNEGKDIKSDSIKGYFFLSDAISFVEQTDTLQLKTCLHFGIEYLLKGIEDENAEMFEVRIIHPWLHNPATNAPSSGSIEVKADCIDEASFDYYCLEYDWELQPVEWLFQVTQLDKLLLEKAFHLYS